MFREFSDNSRSEEFLNEFRQKMADQTASNIEERQDEMRRSRSVFIGALSGLIFAGAVSWLVLYSGYINNEPEQIPVIRRSPEAVKSLPKDRGGMKVENQDKTVYNILENKDDTNVVVEKVLPVPEKPKLPEISAQDIPEEVAMPAKTPTTIDDIIETASEAVVNKAAKNIKSTEEEIKKEEKPEPKPEAENKPATEAKVVSAPVQNVEKTEPQKTQPQQSAKAAEKGDWQIQLMSSPNRDAIEKSWLDLNKKYVVLSGLGYEIETADLGSSGIFYRLKAGAFAQKADADEICAKIKASGGSCIVKKK